MRSWMLLIALALPAAVHADALDDLLEDVRKSQQQSAEINEAREARFLAERDQQDELLRQAQRDLAAVKRRVDAQKAEFQKTAKEIAELKAEIKEQTGELEQLFGTIRTAAGDTRAIVRDSLTSAQFADRLDDLNRLADGERRINLGQLEQFWFILQQEMLLMMHF